MTQVNVKQSKPVKLQTLDTLDVFQTDEMPGSFFFVKICEIDSGKTMCVRLFEETIVYMNPLNEVVPRDAELNVY